METDPLQRLESELDEKLAEEAGAPYACPECGAGAWPSGGSGTRDVLQDGRIKIRLPVRCVNTHERIVETIVKPKPFRYPKRGFY